MNNSIKTIYNHPLHVFIGAKSKHCSCWIVKGVYLQWCNMYKTIRTAFFKRPILSTILSTFLLLSICTIVACSRFSYYKGGYQLIGCAEYDFDHIVLLSTHDATKVRELFKKDRMEISGEEYLALIKTEYETAERTFRYPVVAFSYYKVTFIDLFLDKLHFLWMQVPSFLQNNNITVALQQDFSDDRECFELYKDVVVGWDKHKHYKIENPAVLALIKKLIDENLINEDGWFKDTKSCDRAKTVIEEFINEQK